MILHRLVTMVLILTFVSVSFAEMPSAKDDATKNAETGQKAKDVAPALTLEDHPGDFWSRKHLTGDWGGERAKLAEHGITLDLRLSQFYQGVASGGKNTNFAYGGKLDYILKLDGKKLGLWEGLSLPCTLKRNSGIPLTATPVR